MKKIKAVRCKPGETWLVSIDDKLDLQKVLVEVTYKNAVAIKPAEAAPEPTNDDFFDAAESLDMSLTAAGNSTKKPPATRYIRWSDIDFVEKL